MALIMVWGESSFIKYMENPFRSLKQSLMPSIPKEEMDIIRVRAMKRAGMEEKSDYLAKD